MDGQRVLFVGGPWHGQRKRVAPDPSRRGGLPWTVCVPGPMPMPSILDITSTVMQIPDPFVYSVRWYTSFTDVGADEWPAYFTAAAADPWPGPGEPADVRLADRLLQEDQVRQLPYCVAPGCEEKAPVVFVADESGRLAGRDWQRGDQIRMCQRHAHDVYAAQYVYGRDQLAEWLRPDAVNLDPLDAFDAALDVLYGDAIRESRSRALRVRRDGPG